MKTYQLDPEKFPRIRRNIILSYIFLALIGLGVVYLYIREDLFGQAWTLIPFVCLVFIAGGWFALRQRRKYWEEFRLRIKDDALYFQAPNLPEARIQRKYITGVKEVRNGLILATPGRANTLLVPRDLPDEDFQEIKGIFEEWAGKGD